MGPTNVTEYGEFIRTLVRGIVARYGIATVESTFAFRVGTEPNTQPGHWNDTAAKYIDMYIAVAAVIVAEVPGSRVGPANFAADGPTRQPDWDNVIMPIARGIAGANARVDFLAMSCYGRASMCRKPKPPGADSEMARTVSAETPAPTRWVDHTCEYAPAFASECAMRLRSVQAVDAGWGKLPLRTMEYGDQQNSLGIVDSEPGAFGAAWTLSSSVALAAGGVERAYHWGYGDRNFANDNGACAAPLTPCGLYGGNIWIAAAAGHLFGGNGTATVLANHSNPLAASPQGSPTASGIGGWSPEGELRLLVSAFSTQDDHPPVGVSLQFDRPTAWPPNPSGSTSPRGLQYRTMRLTKANSVYDRIFAEAKANGTLQNGTDPNVYTLKTMLSVEGRANVKANGAAWLELQRDAYTPSPWSPLNTAPESDLSLSCTQDKCVVALTSVVPAALAIWIAVA
jgi:hypothetical protein